MTIPSRADYRIRGMDCAEEVLLLRRQLEHRPGIGELSFDVFHARMIVEFDDKLISPADIEHAVHQTGMTAEPWESTVKAGSFWQEHRRGLMVAISGVCLLGGMILHAAATGHYLEVFFAHQHQESHGPMPWHVLALYLAATAIGAIPVLPKAFASLRQFSPDMNALMVLSVTGAAFLGEWSEAATLSFLFGLAGLLESWSLAKARDAIAKLMQVAPPEANVVHYHGHDDHYGEHEHRTPVDRVPVGSIVRVKPGDRVPFDGNVVRGASFVDQALITGESMPLEKNVGDLVYAGSINQNGMLEVKTTRLASDTTLARMIRMVEQSQSRRAPSEQFVEKFSRIYTPIVFVLAALAMTVPPLLGHGTWSYWFYQGMVILLISCPCALVISTPVSVVAALTAAARHGVLIKGGSFLEAAAKLKVIAFDKTGVLTQGRPEVQQVVPLNGREEREILERLVGLEMSSEHPVARAILRHAVRQGVHAPAMMGFRALQGRGAEAALDGTTFWVGNARLLREKNLLNPDIEQKLARLADSDHTVVACGTGEQAWALLGITDPPRKEARQSIAQLRAAGLSHMVMLTGDSAVAARSVAAAVGVDDAHAELLPDDKAARVRELAARHGPVAMVGDGVNDAQALAEATLGIGVGRQGADIAIETADIVLMSGDLTRLPFLIRHARRTLRIVKENITFALALKAVFLVAAMAGAATLWMAVVADMGATFLVTFNGLRLLRVRS